MLLLLFVVFFVVVDVLIFFCKFLFRILNIFFQCLFLNARGSWRKDRFQKTSILKRVKQQQQQNNTLQRVKDAKSQAPIARLYKRKKI